MDDPAHVGAERALVLMRFLRTGILVLCLVAAGAGWAAGSPTVVGLALVIAAEDAWECSVVVAALRREAGGTPFLYRSAPALPRHRS
jgi:hypothetical protein